MASRNSNKQRIQFDTTKYPVSRGVNRGANNYKAAGKKMKHPYMREGFVFKCCDKQHQKNCEQAAHRISQL
jgi:hypothetical protein